MGTNLTSEELATQDIPENWEPIPAEHYASYLILAMEQIAMVEVSLTRMILQARRPGNPEVGASAGGNVAGLQRAEMYIRGYRTK